MDYEARLKQELKDAQKRVEQAVAASDFLQTPQGQLIQDWVNERVTYLMSKLTAPTPVDDREYLSIHGAVRELQDFNNMLVSKQNGLQMAQEDLNEINRQLTPESEPEA